MIVAATKSTTTTMVVRQLQNQVYKGLIMLFVCSLLVDGMGISSNPEKPLNVTSLLPYNSMDTTQTIELAFLDNEDFRLAFGSCYGLLDYHTDIFSHVRAYKPHIWMWLGDAAYTDHIKAGLCKFLEYSCVQLNLIIPCRLNT